MAETCAKAVSEEIQGIAFGDLFLEDVRAYRERQLKGTGLEPIFPIWGSPTADLAREMIASGVRAKLTCIDTCQLDPSFAGQEFDEKLLGRIAAGCRSVWRARRIPFLCLRWPMLRTALPVSVVQKVVRGQFVFADLTPAEPSVA